MLKSGKLKLADNMIVTAQEASNKAETVFTIYDDTTNTQIASGPIGGGGGGDGDIFVGNKIKIKVNITNANTAEMTTLQPMVKTNEIEGVQLPGEVYSLDVTKLQSSTVNNGDTLEPTAPLDGGVVVVANSLLESATVTGGVQVVENKVYYFETDGELTVTLGGGA